MLVVTVVLVALWFLGEDDDEFVAFKPGIYHPIVETCHLLIPLLFLVEETKEQHSHFNLVSCTKLYLQTFLAKIIVLRSPVIVSFYCVD